jgi:hypothetical protein
MTPTLIHKQFPILCLKVTNKEVSTRRPVIWFFRSPQSATSAAKLKVIDCFQVKFQISQQAHLSQQHMNRHYFRNESHWRQH